MSSSFYEGFSHNCKLICILINFWSSPRRIKLIANKGKKGRERAPEKRIKAIIKEYEKWARSKGGRCCKNQQ